MTYLIDTDWVASWLNGRSDAITLLQTLSPQGLAISLLTYGEIYDGIYHGRHPQAHERVFRQYLRGVAVLSLNRAIMREFARIRGDLRITGQRLSDTDILIAATGMYHHLELVTRNLRHFQRIPNLRLYK
jgi:tRNA(fMet)-specific endonuclease VapC